MRGGGGGDHEDDGGEDVEACVIEEGNVEDDGPGAGEVVVEEVAEHEEADAGVDEAVEIGAVAEAGGGGAEDAAAEGGAVDGPTSPSSSVFSSLRFFRVGIIGGPAALIFVLLWVVVGVREQEIRGRGTEVGDDAVVARGAWFDDLAGEDVGVDDGEVVGGGAEDVGDGGFASCEGAGEAYEEHFLGGFAFWCEGVEDCGGACGGRGGGGVVEAGKSLACGLEGYLIPGLVDIILIFPRGIHGICDTIQ